MLRSVQSQAFQTRMQHFSRFESIQNKGATLLTSCMIRKLANFDSKYLENPFYRYRANT